jgi:hypothetical protein
MVQREREADGALPSLVQVDGPGSAGRHALPVGEEVGGDEGGAARGEQLEEPRQPVHAAPCALPIGVVGEHDCAVTRPEVCAVCAACAAGTKGRVPS